MFPQENIDNMIFYKMMDLPVPMDKEIFFWLQKSETAKHSNFSYSWEEKSELMIKYLSVVEKYGWLYRSLPFVKNLYLCNSISFNNLTQDSDIDLLIICDKNRLWTARFFSVFLFLVTGIRRSKSKIRLKFDLGFYITEDSLNLYNLLIKPYDLYFTYWLAHIVPLYSDDPYTSDNVFKENFWINNYLPNVKLGQNIFLGNTHFAGSTWFKRTIQFIFNGFFGNIVEKLIKLIRTPIVIYKTKNQGKKGWGIVISDTMLKFHGGDIRKLVNFKYKSYNK